LFLHPFVSSYQHFARHSFAFAIKRTLEALASDELLQLQVRVDGSIGAARCGMLRFFFVQ